ncbi:SH3 domain-containing protein [Penicillium cinerascens]|uniref:SH3 domain-containing protein n=1 Tax=Penicillium cinerascens TaxID=70096 RepID=A0A9W9T736_9EURO|nr:SH3 domain-containing protein [Penicillium cinerascens]KAJ5212013.1 SH3 domain-containing protein [Penicillium cinerascens]
MSTTQEKPSLRNPIHNPFPASLSSECKKAGKIIYSFVNSTLTNTPGETAIPRKILANAKGLVICTVFKAAFFGSVRFGSGLMVARMPNGSWSAPSAIALAGLGAGGQFGLELTDFVFVLNTDAAVQTFLKSGNLTMGLNISMALGPGRSAESGAILGTNGIAGIYAYSKTRGVYGGATLEGSVILERSSANKKMYERKLKAMQLLSGEVPPPPEADPLMHILNSDAFRQQSSTDTSTPVELPTESPNEPGQGPPELAAEPLPVPELDGHSSRQEMPSENPHEIAGELENAQSQS